MTEYSSRNISAKELAQARHKGPDIVAIGGGTGLSTMLRGLKECTENITAIVTVADDGGGSGQLRQELGMLPPGDIRNCILALANTEPTMEKILNYRFAEGALAGQSFGNLFLAALNGICESFDEAVERMSEVLAVTGRVLPVTTDDTQLEAVFENGATVLGESKIFDAKKELDERIRRVQLVPPSPKANREALEAIALAEMIVLGPGSLYTSVIPNLLVEGIAEAVAGSAALKVYVCNVMTQDGETEGYTAFDHVQELLLHSRPDLFDVCMVNISPVPGHLIQRYRDEGADPIEIDRIHFGHSGIELRERPLVDASTGYVRHNPRRLCYELMELFQEKRPRAGTYGKADQVTLDWLREQLEADEKKNNTYVPPVPKPHH